MFFVTHAVDLPSQENLDLIIIGDFEGGSGMGIIMVVFQKFSFIIEDRVRRLLKSASK